ncbi:MAG: hypothetical protein JRJ69_02080 [Deltaproteobacteria bacterium]|nr:hypothetical protein [Deltaproteobacteria bacterium]
MNSSKKKPTNRPLNLEEGLLLSDEDMAYMEKVRMADNSDLESYIDFLMEIGAFDNPKPQETFYDEEFEL